MGEGTGWESREYERERKDMRRKREEEGRQGERACES